MQKKAQSLLLWRFARVAVLMAVSLSLSGCDNVRVYGSVGYSSYNGYGGPGRFGTSVSIGGRIY